MKHIKSTFLLLIFGLLIAQPMMATADDHGKNRLEFPRESVQPVIPEGEQAVKVAYLLDKEGSPYIISIESDDNTINHMIYKMIDADAVAGSENTDQTLSITFIYRNNR